MASTVTELLRRRFGGVKSPSPAYVKGSWTQSGDSQTHTITHNLNSSMYVVVFRNTNIRTGVNGVMEGWLFVGVPSNLNVTYSGTLRSIVGYASEARSGTSQYYNNNVPIGNGSSDNNEAKLNARSSTYGFMNGESYEWMAFDLTKATLGSETLATDTRSLEFSNTAQSTNILAVALVGGSPTFNVNNSLGGMYFGNWLNTLYSAAFETRSTWSYSNMLSGYSTGSATTSTITIQGRSNTYPRQAGTYTTYIIAYE